MPIYYKRTRINRRSPFRPFLLFTIIFFVLLNFVVIQFENKYAKRFISPLQMVSVLGESSTAYSELNNIIEDALEDESGDYAFSIKKFSDGSSYELDAHQKFNTASLYKLWVMGGVYELIDQGKLNPNDVLSSNIDDLNDDFDIASDEAELNEGTLTLTVQKALERMITVSDNYSALLLTSKLKVNGIKNFLAKYALTESDVGSSLPKSTAHDMMLFFEKLYKGEIVNSLYSQEMLTLLKRQELNDRIPKYLPSDVVVAHKTGELDYVKHDVGIVYSIKGDYIFIAMSKTPDPQNAAEKIALISKGVYSYFTLN